jgi:acetyl esterase
MCDLKLRQIIPVKLLILVIIIAIWFSSYPRWELPITKIAMAPLDLLVKYMLTDGTVRDRFRVLKGVQLSRTVDSDFEYITTSCNSSYNPIEAVRILIQVPRVREDEKLLDVWLEIHGGGWVLGDETFKPLSEIYLPVSERKKYIVFSPNYRLAPDYKFPTAPEDCYAALKWVKEHAKEFGGNPNRIIIGGSSAGGNLAAVTTIMARNDPSFTPKPLIQILHIPLVDFYLQSESTAKFTETPIWNSVYSLHARRLYIPDASQWSDFRASPLYASTHKDLPPAFIIVNTWDPFYDDGIAYYEKLKTDGVPVSLYSFEAFHGGDMIMSMFGGYKNDIDECGQKLKRFLEKNT